MQHECCECVERLRAEVATARGAECAEQELRRQVEARLREMNEEQRQVQVQLNAVLGPSATDCEWDAPAVVKDLQARLREVVGIANSQRTWTAHHTGPCSCALCRIVAAAQPDGPKEECFICGLADDQVGEIRSLSVHRSCALHIKHGGRAAAQPGAMVTCARCGSATCKGYDCPAAQPEEKP